VPTQIAPLTLQLTDDLADAPGRGVERAVDAASLREAADLLLVSPSTLAGRGDVEIWLLRVGVHALSALVAVRDGEGVVITAIAQTHAEPLLRAVLAHYTLDGVATASGDALEILGER